MRGCPSRFPPDLMPGGVVVAQGTLDPLTQVRILAGQPLIPYPKARLWDEAVSSQVMNSTSAALPSSVARRAR